MRVCPLCGGELVKHPGAINEQVFIGRLGRVERRTRPAVFWACSTCEHCEEVGRADHS
jgi:ssDNA-binding Zn-finger/Zn-ribbon topoisomerase 1